METKELIALMQDSDASREKALVLFMCAAKSLPVLGDITFIDHNLTELEAVVDAVLHFTHTWIRSLQEERVNSKELVELFTESKLIHALIPLYFEGPPNGQELYTENSPLYKKIEQILDLLFENVDVACHDTALFYPYLALLSNRFVRNQESTKLMFAEKLERVLRKNLRSARFVNAVKSSIAKVALTVTDLLATRLNPAWRVAVFTLSATITISYGDLQWLHFQTAKKHLVDAKKLFLLLGILVPIEVRMALDVRQVRGNELGPALLLFETIFLRLAKSEDKPDWLISSLNQQELAQILEHIKSAIETVAAFVCIHIAPLDQDQPALQSDQSYDEHTLPGCLRTLCLYLSEENELLSDRHEQIVLRLLRVLRDSGRSNDKQMCQIILSALHSLAVNSQLVRNLLTKNCSLFFDFTRTQNELSNALQPILHDLHNLLQS